MITKTESLDRIEILMHRSPPALNVFWSVTVDDPDDDQLPIRSTRVEVIEKSKQIMNDEGVSETVECDPTVYDQTIQDILAVVWAD
jgi:hypothetical protein